MADMTLQEQISQATGSPKTKYLRAISLELEPLLLETDEGGRYSNATQVQEALDSSKVQRLLTYIDQIKLDPQSKLDFAQAKLIAIEMASLMDARITLWREQISGLKADIRADAKSEVRQTGLLHEEYEYLKNQIAKQEQVLASAIALSNQTEIEVWAQAIYDRACMDSFGLLFDKQMIQAIAAIVANMQVSKPSLLVGEMGVAKTSLAKFIGHISGGYELISGHADMMSDTITGKVMQIPQLLTEKTIAADGHEILTEKETMVFSFQPSSFVIAMGDGKVVVLDEINFIEPAILARMQDYLLNKPGDIIRIQEGDDQDFVVQPGFTVIATANEVDKRYEYRYRMDNATRDRFQPVRLSYPDVDMSDKRPAEKMPASLLRMASATALDECGYLSQYLEMSDLENVCRLAYQTQYLYTVPARQAKLTTTANYDTTSVLDEDPLMGTCISPRTLVDLIKSVRSGNSDLSLNTAIVRIIEGFEDQQDCRFALSQAKLLGFDTT